MIAAETPQTEEVGGRFRGGEVLRGVGYAVLLFWLNAYICREMFLRYTPKMNSMQGFWIGMARHAGSGWFHSEWWRYWDCGAPLEFVYAPLVPALTAGIAAIRAVPHDVAFQSVSGFLYCIGPVTLFLMAWLLTRAAGTAFVAGVLYSLTSVSQLLTPDAEFAWRHFWDKRRMFVMAVWDETPHMAALALLPLVILFLALSIKTRRPVYYAAAVLSIAGCALGSDFGPVVTMMASVCLLAVLRPQTCWRNALLVGGIGLVAYAICSPFLSPSDIQAIRAASTGGETAGGTLEALGIVAAGGVLLWFGLQRWTADWRLQFFALFAWVTGSVPMIAQYLHKEFVPQPERYKMELEFSLAMLVVFAMRGVYRKFPIQIKICLLLFLIVIAARQTVAERRWAKDVLAPADITKTIEYRAAIFAHNQLPGVRIMMPGSIAKWADAFTDVQQFAGGSWSVAYNPVQVRALAGMYDGGDTPEEDARVSIVWLKAFGTGAVTISGPNSPEYWRGFVHPNKFQGKLPLIWREDDTETYRVPLRSESLAHVVPQGTLVVTVPAGPRDTVEVERYVAALDDVSLPEAAFRWDGSNRIHITADVRTGRAVSIQVTHHKGWRATANGVAREIKADGLGLMWLEPECNGRCDVVLEYNGGAELLAARLLSAMALAATLVIFFWSAVRP